MNNNDININCQEAFNALVTHIRSNYKTAVNLVVLNKALEVALDYSTNCKKDITHRLFRNLQIAQDLALLQCQTFLLACAILLDVPREIVDTLQLQDVSETLEAYDTFGHTKNLLGVKDPLSDRLHHAVLLHCAKAHKELQDDSDVLMYTRIFLQNVLIPAAERMGMRYYVRLLNNDCYINNLWNVQKYSHTDVATCIHALQSVSTNAYTAFDRLMLDTLANQSNFTLLPNNKDSHDHHGVIRRELPYWEVQEQLNEVGAIDRSFLDLWEVTLSYKGDNEEAMMHNYIALHREFLSNNLTLQYISNEDSCVTLRITDMVENNYLLRLIPQSKLRPYYLGEDSVADSPYQILKNEVDTQQISVFVFEDNQYHKIIIPAGATILDMAFYNSPTNAVTVRGARICHLFEETRVSFDANAYNVPLHTALKENDIVAFDVSDPHSTDCGSMASIDWFFSIHTDYAKFCLIEFLKERYQ